MVLAFCVKQQLWNGVTAKYCTMQPQKDIIGWPEFTFYEWVPQMSSSNVLLFFLFVFYIYYDLCTIRANLHFVFIISRSLVFQLLCSQVFIVSFPLFLFTRCMNPLLSECMVQMKANFRCEVYVTHCWYDGAKMICESNCWMIFIIMNFFFFFYRIFFLNILKRF